jgi:hypothetical protein
MTISCHKGQLLKITLNLLLILAFGLGLSLGAIGQDPFDYRDSGTTAQPIEEAALRATELLGYPAENSQGETLGEIEEFMLGLESELE